MSGNGTPRWKNAGACSCGLLGIAVYSLAAADHAVNYGVALYPPGVVFIAVSPS